MAQPTHVALDKANKKATTSSHHSVHSFLRILSTITIIMTNISEEEEVAFLYLVCKTASYQLVEGADY
jgi:hypothetical protein